MKYKTAIKLGSKPLTDDLKYLVSGTNILLNCLIKYILVREFKINILNFAKLVYFFINYPNYTLHHKVTILSKYQIKVKIINVVYISI